MADDDNGARTAAVRALEAEFGELVGLFRRVIVEHAEALSPGMLPGAYKLFTTIVRFGSVNPSALAERLLLDRGQVSRTVRELERLGLVERSPDPADGRSTLISATPEGLERLTAVREKREGALAAALDDWPLEDIREFTRLMHALLRSQL